MHIMVQDSKCAILTLILNPNGVSNSRKYTNACVCWKEWKNDMWKLRMGRDSDTYNAYLWILRLMVKRYKIYWQPK